MTLTRDEQAAVDACETQFCRDEWCDGLCEFCTGGYVLLGDALQAIDDVRSAKKLERQKKLDALLDDY